MKKEEKMIKSKSKKEGVFNDIRVRIAPSPTGPLHIGTARTALFNYLFAKQKGGKFILRIEDTDLERSDSKWTEEILESLKWLGIEWDEGPAPISQREIGEIPNSKFQIPNYIGDFGPYLQSERLDIYEKYIKQLLAKGIAYYCFCGEEQLEAERQSMMSAGQAPKYSGRCRGLKKQEAEARIKKGEKFVIRLQTPSRKISFDDLLREKLEFDAELIGDIVIAKNTKTPLYNFAVVVDDYEMKISHIIRGEDHISNTPKQIAIIEALGFYIPKYLHLPLILAPDRSKLSKRHGAVSIKEYREMGYLPEALVNFMALLGWHPQDDREIFSKEELIKEFCPERVQKAGAVFNIQKLDWLNAEYIKRLEIDDLTERCLLRLIKADFIQGGLGIWKIADMERIIDFNYLKQAVILVRERMKKLSDITELADYFFKRIDYDKELLRWKKMSEDEIKNNLLKIKEMLFKIEEKDFIKEKLEKVIMPEAEKRGPAPEQARYGVDRGEMLWPLRAALSGKSASCGPFEIMEILGKEETMERINLALSKFS